MRTGPWRAVLRMAWRETWRAKGRSALVVALIGLPVLALAAGDTLYHTYSLTALARYQRANGAATVELSWAGGGRVVQAPAGGDNFETSGRAVGVRPGASGTSSVAAVARMLGPGTRVIERRTTAGTVVTRAGLGTVNFVGVDYTNPVAAGLAPQLAGRPPRTTRQVDVTPGLAAQAGLHVGSTLRTVYPTRRFTVAGIVSDPSTARASEAVFLPDALPSGASSSYVSTDFLAVTQRPVTWAGVLRLDQRGYVVDSRSVAVHPPPASQVHIDASSATSDSRAEVISGVVVVGLSLLEVILLAGPAFAVMARRQERSLALMAATGARAGDLRNAVLAYGVVLGSLAGVLAVGLGVGAARLSLPVIAHFVARRPGPFAFRPVELVGILLVSLVTALVAAVTPARAAGRSDVVAALAGRRPRRPARLRVPLTAVAVAGLGVVTALYGAERHDSYLIVAGIAVMELGLVVTTPTILLIVTKAGGRLPLAPRLALRDAGRNRSSAAPAVAAVMAAVIGCVAALVGVASQSARDQRGYVPQALYGEVSVTPDPGTSRAVAAAMGSTLPARQVLVISQLGCDGVRCPTIQVAPRIPAGQSRVTRARQNEGSLTGLVAGPSALPALTGVSSRAAEAALADGKVIVPDAWSVDRGTATLDVITYGATGTPRVRAVTAPAMALTTGLAPAAVIVPPSLVGRFGTGSSVDEVLAYDRTMPTRAEQQALASALAAIAFAHPVGQNPDDATGMSVHVERGYHDPLETRMLLLILAASLVAIAAAGIATGLSNSDRSEDFLTLDAVGAGAGTRRVVSAARGAVIAGIGAAVGTVAGFVPVLAYVVADNRYSRGASLMAQSDAGLPGSLLTVEPSDRLGLVVPWGELALVVIGIPVAAALLAGLLSRSRLPLSRRALLARFG